MRFLIRASTAVLGCLLHAVLAASASAASTKMPNVLIILADDLGYGDVQCYNPERGRIPTPYMDRLAAEGMRFTDAHSSSSVCSPSRYTLLTGRYHWRSSLQVGIVGVFGNALIAPERLTIAGLARQHGYRTTAIGKWHLGWDWGIDPAERSYFDRTKLGFNSPALSAEQQRAWRTVFERPIANGPTTRGFDRYFGVDVPNWPPYCYIENDRCTGLPSEWLPQALMGKHLAGMPGPAVKGWDLEAVLPALAERACSEIESLAKGDSPFLMYLSLSSPHHPMAVPQAWLGKSGLNLYADFVMQTDAVVGQVMDTLAKAGVVDNTLVLFTSDNGKDRDLMAELEQKGHFPSGPLRGRKHQAWEGGHRMPFLVRWPAMVKPGTTCPQLVHQADMMATLAEVLGVRLPDHAGEDSFSLLPLLRGGREPIRQYAVSCAGSGVPTIRSGPWKLILEADKPEEGPVQLYDLENDLGETRNLALQHPERVTELKALLEKLISDGRSTPGALQANDVEVKSYPLRAPAPPKAKEQRPD